MQIRSLPFELMIVVDGDSGLARLPVADYKLALAATDGHHRIDSFQTRLHGLAHGLAVHNARGYAFERAEFAARLYGAATVERAA